MSPIDVDPGELAAASDHFGRAVWETGSLLSSLTGSLVGSGGMAGTDDAGTTWARDYDATVEDALNASTKLTIGSGQLAAMIHMTGLNHAEAEAASNQAGRPSDYPKVSENVATGARPADVPSAAGGGSPEPFGWNLISDLVGYAWPNGHQDQLRSAGAAWKNAASALPSAAAPIDAATALVQGQQSPEIPDVVTACTEIRTHYRDLGDGYTALGESCEEYAQHLDDAHSSIIEMVTELALETAAMSAAGAALSFFSAGASGAAAAAAISARCAVVAARVAAVIRRLIAAARVIGAALRPAIVKVGEVLSKLGKAIAERAKSLKPRKPGGGRGSPSVPPAVKPEVADPKLDNILGNLYKGAKNPDRIGSGHTADALRNEFLTGEPTAGRWHLQKALESRNALFNWLQKNPNASTSDRAVAERELQMLYDAMAGR